MILLPKKFKIFLHHYANNITNVLFLIKLDHPIFVDKSGQCHFLFSPQDKVLTKINVPNYVHVTPKSNIKSFVFR